MRERRARRDPPTSASAPLPPGAAAPEGSGEEVLEAAGPALFRLVRFWARRASRHSSDGPSQQALVVAAIATAETQPDSRPVSVAAVAHALGVDRSVGSRLVGDAVRAGLVRRRAAAADARFADLTLTDAGGELLARTWAWQRQLFDQLTGDWPAAEREEFARLLVRFTAVATQEVPTPTLTSS